MYLNMEEISMETASTHASEAIPSESMVILVQQGEEGELTVPVFTAESNSLDQQVITFVSGSYGITPQDYFSSVPVSNQGLALVQGRGNESLSSTVRSEDTAPRERAGTFETEDGQILYVTYTINPIQEEANSSEGVTTDQQRMILHVSEDGSTVVLPAEDRLNIVGNVELPQITIDSVYSLSSNSNCDEDELAGNVAEVRGNDKDTLKQHTFFDVNNRKRTEQVIGSDLRIEEKFEVLNAMLTPIPPKVKRVKKDLKKIKEKEKEKVQEEGEATTGTYVCDMCGVGFPRAAQYYGHLHTHSGERKWECSLCPGEVEFLSQSQLRRHEKQCHLNLRPHVCSLCPARFDRASQLSYHERRIHAGERPHTCQICHKGFFKRSDLRTHLNIHLGINKSICETCGKKFNHVSNLIRHTRMHSGVKPYPCIICGKRFTQLNAMHQHKVSHQTGKDVPCSMCNKMFKSYSIMRKHARHMHGDDCPPVPETKPAGQSRRFYCKVCGDSFEFAALLKEHEKRHEKENSFHCGCCDQDYDSVDLLKTHSCQTPEERMQRAVEAEAERLSLESLLEDQTDLARDDGELIIYVTQEGQNEPTQVHIKQLTTDPEMKSLVLYDNNDVTSHEGTNKNNELDKEDPSSGMLLFNGNVAVTSGSTTTTTTPSTITGAGASLRLDLQMDSLYMNVNTPPSSPLLQQNTALNDSTSDPYMTCGEVLLELERDSECENQAVDPLSITKHKSLIMPTHQEQHIDVSSDLDPRKKKTRIYKCPECPKTFLKNSNYKQHLGTHFIDQMNYCCPTCGMFFAWKSTLNKHILRSHTATPMPLCRCEICFREYTSAGQVQEHIKRDHYKQRPHACPVCNKTFYKKHDLKIHFRTHTKERPYICGTCGKSFYHLSHIIRHERIHSGQRPYKCPDCGRQFNQSSSLKSHRQRHVHCLDKTNLEGLELELAEEVVQAAEFPMDQGNILLYTGPL